MALTLADYKAHIKHALGGGDPAVIVTDADTTKKLYVNEAGRLLVSAREWKFLERPSTTVNYTSGVSYVALPSDCRKVISVRPKRGYFTDVRMTTFEAIDRMRSIVNTSVGITYLAVSHPTQTSASASPGAPRLEIYPTPSSSITDALTVRYAAGWTELSSDTDVANIPVWAEGLLVLLCRAIAKGYEEESLNERVAAVLAGPVFSAVVDQDGMIQQDYGVLGIGQVADDGPMVRFTDQPIADPS